MKPFCLSLFPVHISAALITILLLVMMMSSSTGGFEITVNADQMITKDSNQITVVVNCVTSVKELKKLIKEKTEIELKKQTLQLQNPNGTTTMLYNSGMMADYGIEEGAVILLFIKFAIKVKPNRPMFGNTFSVEVDGTDTVEELKKKIKDTLEDNIETKHAIKRKRITLQYDKNDDFLKDEQTINHYQIKKGDIIHLSIGEFEIYVRQYGKNNEVKEHTIWVNGEETVAILKKKIKNQSGIVPEEQILKCDTKNGPVLEEDGKTLNDYGIGKDSKILLSINFVITVMDDEHIFNKLLPITKTITVKVNGWDKVEDFKKNIMKTLAEKDKTKYGSDFKRLTLCYDEDDDYDILNDGQTIDDYGINKNDSVHLTIGEFQVIAVQYEKKNELKKYHIWVNGEETVAILKKKIQNESGIKFDDQTLKVVPNGDGDGTLTVLEDEKAMTNYGIGKDSTVLIFTEFEIVVKYKKDNVEKMFTVQMKGTDQIYHLREKCMEQIKDVFKRINYIAINDHPSPNFNRELNEDKKTLKNCGIGEGTTIYLVSGWVVDPEKKYIKHRVKLM